MIDLSSEQLAACAELSGQARIVAGAGTGKTAVIAERVRRLVAGGVDPASILVMTFTERAAAEMRERIEAASGCELPNAGTFHSLALRWLREHRGGGLPPHFRILAGVDRWIHVRELMWELGDTALVGDERPDDLVMPLLKLMERCKQELVRLPDLVAWARRRREVERRELLLAAARLFSVHADRCRRAALADFDDLLLRAVRMIEGDEALADRLRTRHRWILVDEYQDCNAAQERLVELLGAPGGNVCVVGDDDQGIYRFRGASRASMERFATRFPSARTLTLGANRRSTRAIVAAATALIGHGEDRMEKPLRAAAGADEGVPISIWECEDGAAEADAVAVEISRMIASGTPPERIAVLTRSHAVARPFLEALEAAGVPARHRAAQGFFRRPEVRDLIAYVRLVDDVGDVHSLSRLLTRPPLSLDLERALTVARGEDGVPSLLRLREWAPTAGWAGTVLELSVAASALGVDELLFEILERTRHLDAIVPAAGVERQRVLANVERFSQLVADWCERRRDHSLSLFVAYIDLVLRSGVDEQEAQPEGADDAVQIMSIHQAKGLEFDAVVVPALVEGRLPQPHRAEALELPAELAEAEVREAAEGRADHLAEERRLLYVAMTRARRRLVLSWAHRYEGARRWRRSRFLDEVDEAAATHVTVTPFPAPARAEAVPPPSPERAAGPPPALSFSSISAYRECPRQFWFRYRLRLPPAPTLEAQLGTAVHDALLGAGRVRQEGRELEEGVLRDIYAEAWDGVVAAEPRRRPVMEALGWRLLSTFWRAGGLDARPHLLERSFTADMGGWRLRGIIDRVDREGGDGAPERWRILDYKTGRPLPASRLRRDLQLALYALGARHLGLEPVGLEIVYLREMRRVRVEADAALIEQAGTAGAEVAEGVREGRFEPRPERRRCGLCSYRMACPAAL